VKVTLFLLFIIVQFLSFEGRAALNFEIDKVQEQVVQTVTAPNKCRQAGLFKPEFKTDLKRIDANDYHKNVQIQSGRSFKQVKHQGHNVSVMSLEEAQALFMAFSEIDYMKFKYLHDGCYRRAHEFALIAQQNGITMGKVFLSHADAHSRLIPKDWKDNDNAPVPIGFVGWYYHVTPYVMVEVDGELVPYSFDVGVADKAQSLEDWKENLSQKGHSYNTTFREVKYIYHDDDGELPGESIIKSDLEDQEMIAEMGIDDFLYYRERGMI
jgi:hypothetical protein